MKLHRTIPALLLAALMLEAAPSCSAQSDPSKLNYDKSYALVIGISEYEKDEFGYAVRNKLDNAAGDAHSMAELLKHTGFDEVTELYGLYGPCPEDELKRKTGIQAKGLYDHCATRENILDALDELRKKAGPNDRVLFYFAGHGHTEKISANEYKNYIIPYNATLKLSSFIALAELETYSRDDMKNVKHQLFILDSCYGGALGNEAEGTGQLEKMTADRLLKITQPYVREVLTAGKADEKVLDGSGETGGHSHFTGRLLEALNGAADFYHDGFITFTELKAYLRQNYSKNNTQQHLHSATLAGHKLDCDFVFKNPKENLRILVSQVFEPREMSLEQRMALQMVAPGDLSKNFDWVRNAERISNLEFDTVSTGDETRTTRGAQRQDTDVETPEQKYDYKLELKYSPLDKNRLSVKPEFTEIGKNLRHIDPLEPEVISADNFDSNLLVRKILRQFASNDLHLHLKSVVSFECPECDSELRGQVESAIRSWLSANRISGIKYVKDLDDDRQKDFNVTATIKVIPEGDHKMFLVAIIVEHYSASRGKCQKMESADIASWTNALEAVQKKAEACITDLVKKF